jgi:hypothetical protein
LLAVILFLVVYIVIGSCIPRLEDHIPNVLAFTTVWAHVVGFALMNHIAFYQDYFVELLADKSNATSVFGVAVGVWFAYFVLSYLALYVVYHSLLASCVTEETVQGPDLMEIEDGHKHIEHPFHLVKAHLREFSAEVGALALSYTFMRAFCGSLIGELPEVFQVSGPDKTTAQIAQLFGFAVICTIGAAILHAAEKKIYTCCPQIGRIGILFSTTFMTFLTAFSYLQAMRWATYSKNETSQHSLYHHIAIGMTTSYLGLAFNLISCKQCQCRFLLEIAKIFAVLAAFTWELSLDIMLEQASHLNKSQTIGHLYDSLFILVLLAFLSPMFICGVYPTTHVAKANDKSKLVQAMMEEEEEEDGPDDIFEESDEE